MEKIPRFENSDEIREKAIEANETEKELAIYESTTFNALYEALEKVGSIQGSQGVYHTEQLIGLIERVRSGELTTDYVTRTLGLRSKVEELLQTERRKGHDSPPPLHAAVALEIPREKTSEPAEPKLYEPHTPDGPPALETAAEAIPPSDLGTVGQPERPPEEPIEPLDTTEEEFLHKVDQSNEPEFRTLNPEVAAKYNLKNKDIAERYAKLQERLTRWETMVMPSTFDELHKTLKTAAFLTERNKTRLEESPQELSERIRRIERGEEKTDSLPEIIRGGVETLIAKSIVQRLEEGIEVEIADHEWEVFLKQFPMDSTWGQGGQPEIGSREVYTRDAKVDGELVWSDKTIVVFKTERGYRSIPYEDLVLENGKTRKEIRREERESHRRKRRHNSRQQLRERSLGE